MTENVLELMKYQIYRFKKLCEFQAREIKTDSNPERKKLENPYPSSTYGF